MRVFPAVVLTACVCLSGCGLYKSTPDPVLDAHDREWLAASLRADVDIPYERYLTADTTGQPPGTIVVDTRERLLYYVLPGGKMIRYGVTVGDEAYGWTGTAHVARKAQWPDWTPPAEMKRRWPQVHFTKGGPESPLGARALYLYDENGHDTLYRIHGTNEPEKIGHAASSGCIRMRNIDAIDLYNRAGVGAKVIVR